MSYDREWQSVKNERLSVMLNPEVAAALRAIKQANGITYTEAIRRAISVYAYMQEATDQGKKILVSDDYEYRELRLL